MRPEETMTPGQEDGRTLREEADEVRETDVVGGEQLSMMGDIPEITEHPQGPDGEGWEIPLPPAEQRMMGLRGDRQQVRELADSGRVVIPTSLAFWGQPDTAAQFPNAVNIPADRFGTVIRARISGHDGNRVHITRFDCQMEATIAQLVEENGLPLVVTPAQIYRKYAVMGREERVTKKQEEDVIASIDKLIVTPATLDFTQEIQNHTKLKRDPRYNYSNTVIEGTLITGVRISQTTVKAASPDAAEKQMHAYFYKGRIVENAYVIYAMPMYAVHDQMVGQLATFPARLLNSPEGVGHQEDLPEKREPTNARHVSSMRYYILLQVNRMKRAFENEKLSARRRYADIPRRHTEKLSFAKIAENSDIVITPRSLRTLRTNTERILHELQAEQMILEFSTYKKGRAIDGVTITV